MSELLLGELAEGRFGWGEYAFNDSSALSVGE